MASLKQPRALITGGAGFIGSHLARHLLDANYRVMVMDNLSTGRLSNLEKLAGDPNFQFAIEDVRNAMVLDRLVSECDVIFHLAAAVGVQRIVEQPIETIETNIGGTEIVLKTALRYRKKVLIVSTSEVYGKSEKVPYSEEDGGSYGATTKSRWSYAVTKALDEFLALAYFEAENLPIVIVRLFNTVGPGQTGTYGMVVPRFVQWALQNKPIQVYGTGEQTRCFCNVSDVVKAMVKLSETPEAVGEIFNIGNTHEISIFDLASRIKTMAHSQSPIEIIPYDQAYKPGFEDMFRRVPDIAKIKRFIGWEPITPLDETIRQVIDYYRHNGD